MLLGAVTALLVARPLVAGEDPGRLHSPESLSGIVLNFLWLIALVAGAVWLARSRRPMRVGGLLPICLALVPALILLSTFVVSCYRHPGWLMAWEWVTIALSFLLVAAVAADSDPDSDSAGGILAAIMASVVSLAAFGIYQSVAAWTNLPSPELSPLNDAGLPLEAGFLRLSEQNSMLGICRGMFDRADTFAALLILVLPLFVALAIRDRGGRSRTALALSLLLVVPLAFSLRDYLTHDFLPRLQGGAQVATQLIAERPLLGVGPGNFDRYSPQLQPVELPYILSHANSAYLDFASTGGILVALAILAAIGLMIFGIRRLAIDKPTPSGSIPPIFSRVRWEFYMGGVVGLLLGLGLRLADLPGAGDPHRIYVVGAGAVGRALVWFLTFALFEGVPWRTAARRNAILAGIGGAAIFGLISPATLWPAIAQMIVILAALAFASRVEIQIVARTPARWVPVPPLIAVVVINFFLVSYPICRSAAAVTEARRAGRHYPEMLIKAGGVRASQSSHEMQALDSLLNKVIRPQISDATDVDPFDVDLRLEWAEWFCAYWNLHPDRDEGLGLQAVSKAQELDPHGTRPLVDELLLRVTYAVLDERQFRPDDKRVDRKRLVTLRNENLDAAESLVHRIIAADPALEARARLRFAQALRRTGDPARQKRALDEARKIVELDQNAPGPRWQLKPEERRVVQAWLMPPEPSHWWQWRPSKSNH